MASSGRVLTPEPCPHREIRHCPLYAESHHARGLGCVDDLSAACRVSRHELGYGVGVERVLAVDPRLVFDCYAAETVETGRKDGEAGRALLRARLERDPVLPPAQAIGGGPADPRAAQTELRKALDAFGAAQGELAAVLAKNVGQ